MISTSSVVFLGVVVQPKTKQPVFVQRRAFTARTVDILSIEGLGYTHSGDGYLEDKGGDFDYLRPTEVTGLPRSHTPSGVKKQGGGFGTCLYTGLVLLADARARNLLDVPSTAGRGSGICSESYTRSAAATRWWRAALERGLTHQEEGEIEGPSETETEELEGEDVFDHVSSRQRRSIEGAIEEAVSDHSGWSVSGISIAADLSREVEAESDSEYGSSVTADYYKIGDAERSNLIAVEQVIPGDIMAWAKWKDEEDHGDKIFKDVILALNVAHEDLQVAARLALLAKHAGATELEVTRMMQRNKYGYDSLRAVTLSGEPQMVLPLMGARRRTRKPPATEGGAPQENPPTIPVPRRNPPPSPTASDRRDLEREAEALERRRDDLGWSKIEDLP
jgi:hypothetical protein